MPIMGQQTNPLPFMMFQRPVVLSPMAERLASLDRVMAARFQRGLDYILETAAIRRSIITDQAK